MGDVFRRLYAHLVNVGQQSHLMNTWHTEHGRTLLEEKQQLIVVLQVSEVNIEIVQRVGMNVS